MQVHIPLALASIHNFIHQHNLEHSHDDNSDNSDNNDESDTEGLNDSDTGLEGQEEGIDKGAKAWRDSIAEEMWMDY